MDIFFVLIAGILWGCMGLFVRPLNKMGLSTWDIVFLRAVLTTLFMFIVLLIKDRKLFRIKFKDTWCFLGTGLLSIVFFNMCYFKEITITTLSVASILLYTAPAFVMLISAVCFKEKLTGCKLIALLLAFIGLIFVTGVLSDADRLTPKIILIGLGAGLGYALYSIFGRYALDRGYNTFTISFYTFLFATFGTVFFAKPIKVADAITADYGSLFLAFAFVMISTVIPYLTYTLGLRTVENGRASIIASIEPVVATLNGIIIYKEKLTFSIVIGTLFVLAGIVLSNIKIKKR